MNVSISTDHRLKHDENMRLKVHMKLCSSIKPEVSVKHRSIYLLIVHRCLN